MTRVVLLSVALLTVAVNAASFHRNHQRQTNPFQGIPDLSTLGFCLTECATVSVAQVNQTFTDLSAVCTATFASQVGNCMQCIGKTPLTAFLTDQIKQKIQEAKQSYESQCDAAGSHITVDIGSAFSVESSTANSASVAASTLHPASTSATPTSTLSSTGSPSPTTGAGYVNAPSIGMAAAAAIVVFAAI